MIVTQDDQDAILQVKEYASTTAAWTGPLTEERPTLLIETGEVKITEYENEEFDEDSDSAAYMF